MIRERGWQDRLVAIADQGLKTLSGAAEAARASPALYVEEAPLTDAERRTSAGLMRVNHAGEIAAQALYHGQSLLARTPATRDHLLDAADQEKDHLVWCGRRLDELGGRPSRLDPFWYFGSVAVGLLAGTRSDRVSLGFVAETERQVEAHLGDHLARLPARDARSRAVLRQMSEDEVRHGAAATSAGGIDLPWPARRFMMLGGGLLRRIARFV